MKPLLLALALTTAAWGLDVSKLEPSGYVNDFAGVLDAQARQVLETYCGNVERSTGAQIAIVTVKSLEGDTVEDAAVRLFEKWKVGNAKTDEGVLVLLAVEDRKNRIEVGYGLEPVIPDGAAGDVLRAIRPVLRQGDYGGALLAAAQLLGQRIADAKGVAIEGQPQRRRRNDSEDGIPGIMIVFILFAIVMSLLGGGRRGGGGGGDILTGILLGQMMSRRRGGGGWSSGGFGGGGGGGWGGGGFGGFGGGSSGGGGASGGW